jgi:hypothetical protein
MPLSALEKSIPLQLLQNTLRSKGSILVDLECDESLHQLVQSSIEESEPQSAYEQGIKNEVKGTGRIKDCG